MGFWYFFDMISSVPFGLPVSALVILFQSTFQLQELIVLIRILEDGTFPDRIDNLIPDLMMETPPADILRIELPMFDIP